jgi:hypothetical protein
VPLDGHQAADLGTSPQSLGTGMGTGPVTRCAVCRAPMGTERSTRKFCSDRCRQQNHRDRRNGKRNGKGLGGLSRVASMTERGLDLYESPSEAVLALLRAEQLPPVIWEPAAGRGAIARVLRAAGHSVIATDLIRHDGADSDITGGVDFLKQPAAPDGVGMIVTNPPYGRRLAERFAEHALRLCLRVALLCRSAWAEGAGRSALLDGGRLARIHQIIERLPMMHREGWTGRRLEESVYGFSWFVFDREHRGPATFSRVSCRKRDVPGLTGAGIPPAPA